jgi:anti-sigma regulatory factor (Ser/Thr protein kinase)
LRELALHLLDIVENSVSAHADTIQIVVEENSLTDRLSMIVEDNGAGMDADMLARVVDPFVTSRTTRKVGLGIPLLKAAAEACNGYFNITSTPGQGTRVEVVFQRSHIDRMPLGNLPATLITLVVGLPHVHWLFRYQVDDRNFEFDDEPIKSALDGLSLSEPSILGFLREMLEEGINGVAALPQAVRNF